MGAQMTQALENVRLTLEEAGATIDDIVHYVFYFTDRESFWAEGLPARAAFFKKHSKTKDLPCVTSVMVAGLMTPDMMIEIEATAVFD
jgi:enamine deaminase RidA (YjgF/YER057c/UK114 family)